jgi:uncharacterized protein YndB with AHSA1/START domain
MTTRQATVTLPSDSAVLVTREFDAPRELVWEAMSSPEHLKHWYGCEETPLIECVNDVRVGGTYRNVSRLPDGSTFAFSGEYLEVDPPARVVYIERFEPMPGAECRVTSTLDDLGGRTLMSVLMDFGSPEVRDGALATGMETGMLAAYDRLEDLVGSLR